MTRDAWHMTHDRLEEVNLFSKFQLHSSYCLGEYIFEDLEERKDLGNQLMNPEGVCRTAPAGYTRYVKCIAPSVVS